MLYEILKPVAVGVMRLGFGLRARGTEHVPLAGAALFVSNHSSLLDPPLVGGASPRTLHFLAKAELFGIPLFGRLIHALNSHPVRREGADAGALRAALRVLEEGHALLVFPEGTRGPEGMLREGKPGAGMLAVLSAAPVVPVYIEGSGRAWPKGRRFPRPARVTVTFGKPLHFARAGAEGRKEQYAAAGREMMAAIATLGARRISPGSSGGGSTVGGHGPGHLSDSLGSPGGCASHCHAAAIDSGGRFGRGTKPPPRDLVEDSHRLRRNRSNG